MNATYLLWFFVCQKMRQVLTAWAALIKQLGQLGENAQLWNKLLII